MAFAQQRSLIYLGAGMENADGQVCTRLVFFFFST